MDKKSLRQKAKAERQKKIAEKVLQEITIKKLKK